MWPVARRRYYIRLPLRPERPRTPSTTSTDVLSPAFYPPMLPSVGHFSCRTVIPDNGVDDIIERFPESVQWNGLAYSASLLFECDPVSQVASSRNDLSATFQLEGPSPKDTALVLRPKLEIVLYGRPCTVVLPHSPIILPWKSDEDTPSHCMDLVPYHISGAEPAIKSEVLYPITPQHSLDSDNSGRSSPTLTNSDSDIEQISTIGIESELHIACKKIEQLEESKANLQNEVDAVAEASKKNHRVYIRRIKSRDNKIRGLSQEKENFMNVMKQNCIERKQNDKSHQEYLTLLQCNLDSLNANYNREIVETEAQMNRLRCENEAFRNSALEYIPTVFVQSLKAELEETLSIKANLESENRRYRENHENLLVKLDENSFDISQHQKRQKEYRDETVQLREKIRQGNAPLQRELMQVKVDLATAQEKLQEFKDASHLRTSIDKGRVEVGVLFQKCVELMVENHLLKKGVQDTFRDSQDQSAAKDRRIGELLEKNQEQEIEISEWYLQEETAQSKLTKLEEENKELRRKSNVLEKALGNILQAHTSGNVGFGSTQLGYRDLYEHTHDELLKTKEAFKKLEEEQRERESNARSLGYEDGYKFGEKHVDLYHEQALPEIQRLHEKIAELMRERGEEYVYELNSSSPHPEVHERRMNIAAQLGNRTFPSVYSEVLNQMHPEFVLYAYEKGTVNVKPIHEHMTLQKARAQREAEERDQEPGNEAKQGGCEKVDHAGDFHSGTFAVPDGTGSSSEGSDQDDEAKDIGNGTGDDEDWRCGIQPFPRAPQNFVAPEGFGISALLQRRGNGIVGDCNVSKLKEAKSAERIVKQSIDNESSRISSISVDGGIRLADDSPTTTAASEDVIITEASSAQDFDPVSFQNSDETSNDENGQDREVNDTGSEEMGLIDVSFTAEEEAGIPDCMKGRLAALKKNAANVNSMRYHEIEDK